MAISRVSGAERRFGAAANASRGGPNSGPSSQSFERRLPRQLLVLCPVRDDGILPQPSHLVLFVILEIAFEPFDMAVVLEGEHVGGDAVEEPAVMADDHGATR